MDIFGKSAARLACATLIAFSCPAQAINYQDWWWNPSQSGMGVSIAQQANTVVAAWYLYGDDGKAAFLYMAGPLNGGAVGGTVEGTLYRMTGMPPGPSFNPASVVATAVGSASINFTSDTTAVLAYSYDNGSRAGTLNLQRWSFAPLVADGTYQLLMRRVDSCNLRPPITSFDRVQGVVSTTATTLNLTLTSSSGQPICSFSINHSQSGSIIGGSGTATCAPCGSQAGTATATLRTLRQIDDLVLSLRIVTTGDNSFLSDEWTLTGTK
jgi:hypothetical protein